MGELQASHTVEIEAPIDRVFEVAADIASCDVWTPSVDSLEVLEKHPDGRVKLVEMQNDAVIKKTATIISYEYAGPERMTWKQEEGEAKWMTGSWELESLGDDRTRATYSLQTDPGRMLSMLLRGPVEGKVKEFLTKGAAEGLKEHVESGG